MDKLKALIEKNTGRIIAFGFTTSKLFYVCGFALLYSLGGKIS
jgi:hypothetical protein